MSKNKRSQIPTKNEVSLRRSSAAEYLTFVAATGSAQTSVEMRYEDENIWLTQKMIATDKLQYAIHGQTAAEVIVDRADHRQQNMGLTSWDGAPQGKIYKYDVAIAKNYLSEFELAQMQRIVSAYLDMAELQAMRRIPMTMADWEERLGGFLKLWDRDLLQDAGKVTAEIAKAHAESEFEKYRIVQDRLFESDFDWVIKQIEAEHKPDGDDE